MLLDCCVLGKPHPLIRSRSNGGRHYDPPENQAAKTRIQYAMRWKGLPHQGPVRVQIVCEYTRKTPTADVDNLSKTVLDAMNRYVLVDDRQVMDLHVVKRGGQPVDRTLIRMETCD